MGGVDVAGCCGGVEGFWLQGEGTGKRGERREEVTNTNRNVLKSMLTTLFLQAC